MVGVIDGSRQLEMCQAIQKGGPRIEKWSSIFGHYCGVYALPR